MSKPVQSSLQTVKEAQQAVTKNLQGTEFSFQLLEINALFDRLKRRLVFMGAIDSPSSSPGEQKAAEKFPPITNYMGKRINKAPKVMKETKETTKAKLAEDPKQVFRQDVESLLLQIGEIDDEALLSKYVKTPYEKILRGVAKVVGVKDFSSKTINKEFLEEVKLGAAIVLEERAAKAKLDEEQKSKTQNANQEQ